MYMDFFRYSVILYKPPKEDNFEFLETMNILLKTITRKHGILWIYIYIYIYIYICIMNT